MCHCNTSVLTMYTSIKDDPNIALQKTFVLKIPHNPSCKQIRLFVCTSRVQCPDLSSLFTVFVKILILLMAAQFILKPKGTLNTTYVNFIFQIMFWFQGEAKTINI